MYSSIVSTPFLRPPEPVSHLIVHHRPDLSRWHRSSDPGRRYLPRIPASRSEGYRFRIQAQKTCRGPWCGLRTSESIGSGKVAALYVTRTPYGGWGSLGLSGPPPSGCVTGLVPGLLCLSQLPPDVIATRA
ncbi:hypothetical protein B0H10DRAFT_2061338 [Mycena sp. CBHHK59/15]|nr:hypothetical protein B0H10DRAFT_2061338 [Mycena sp. CBHHK59/15]